MIKILTTLTITIILCNTIIAQINDLPDIKRTVWFSEGIQEYNDTIPRNKVRSNGMPHIVYTNKNSKLIRKEYFKSGCIKSISEITQKIVKDTTYYHSYDSPNGKIVILNRLVDTPNGLYLEYFENRKEERLKEKGQCLNGRKIGEWTTYDKQNNKTLITFSDEGQFDGDYKEFYFNSQDSSFNAKIVGQFKTRTYTVNYTSKKNGNQINRTIIEERRTGTWKYFAKDGTLLEETTYNWIPK